MLGVKLVKREAICVKQTWRVLVDAVVELAKEKMKIIVGNRLL